MCYQFNHNEQGVVRQCDIIYCSAQHNGVKWANSREFWKLMGILKEIKSHENTDFFQLG